MKTADASENGGCERDAHAPAPVPVAVGRGLSGFVREGGGDASRHARRNIDLHRKRSFKLACLCVGVCVCVFDNLLHSRHRFPWCEVHLKCTSRKKAQEKKEDMIAMTRATVFCGLLGVAAGYSFGVRSALSASRRMRGGITTVDSAARVPEGAV